ncbi:unnamed protein product, partial [Cylicostephanus goldi]
MSISRVMMRSVLRLRWKALKVLINRESRCPLSITKILLSRLNLMRRLLLRVMSIA